MNITDELVSLNKQYVDQLLWDLTNERNKNLRLKNTVTKAVNDYIAEDPEHNSGAEIILCVLENE